MEDCPDWLGGAKLNGDTDLRGTMIGKERNPVLEDDSDEEDDIWRLRKEYEFASKALRKRDSSERGEQISDNLCETGTKMKAGRGRRPGIVHRKTDPTPLRDFADKLSCVEEAPCTVPSAVRRSVNISPTISEEDESNYCESPKITKSVLNEERFLMTSYQLATRRLSLPASKPNIEPHCCCNESKGSVHELEQVDELPEIVAKSCPRPSPRSTEHHVTMAERRRRQSACPATRRTSAYMCDDMRRHLGKRRMSELPALSTLATRRRSAPHTLSVPTGLKRRGSRAGNSSLDYQTVKSASTRAKNEMLATLSMSSWLQDTGEVLFQETGRRKSFHTGFGVMALKKKEEKRLMVAHEILQTEKNYIKALETLNEVFIEPFYNACVIPEKDIRTLFPKQLQIMKDGHISFMRELEERLNNWKWQGVLGDIFTKLCNSYHIDFLTVYSEYVANFPKSVAIINKYSRSSHKFRKLIEKCTVDPRCERLNLSAFLLTPIQRLPRYVLLLRQLSKYTDPNHPDSFHIEISLDKMISIINLLNSSIQNSTRVMRKPSQRHANRRRKKHIFKVKDINSHLTSPRKSSDESDSGRSTPGSKNLTLELSTTAEHQNKSSDYGSLSNSETASPPTSPMTSPVTSPVHSSGSKSSFLKVILRSNSESKKNKRRPLSMSEVEIFNRKDEHLNDCKHPELKRSVSRDSLGSIIRHKFGSLRSRKHKGSDENLSRHGSYDRLDDADDECKVTLFKTTHANTSNERLAHEGPTTPESAAKSPGTSLGEGDDGKPQSPYSEHSHSGSSVESCSESREHFHTSHEHSSTSREHSSTSCAHLSTSHGAQAAGHSDSDQDLARPVSPTGQCSRPTSRQADCNANVSSCSVTENNAEGVCNEMNCAEAVEQQQQHQRVAVVYRDKEGHHRTDDEKSRRKLAKRNSFTDVVKHFFASKSRSNSPESCKYHGHSASQLSKSSKEKVTTV